MKAKSTPKSEFLAAALRQFARHGFAATTTRNIMEDLGLSAAALYYHFPSKADLLYEVLINNYQPMLDGLRNVLEGIAHEPVNVRMSEAIRYTTLLFMNRRREMRVIEADSRFLDDEKQSFIQSILREYNSIVREILVEGIEAELWRVDDASVFTNMLFGLMQCRWYRPDGPKSPGEIADVVVQLAERLLQAPLPQAGQSKGGIHTQRASSNGAASVPTTAGRRGGKGRSVTLADEGSAQTESRLER